MVSFLSPDFWLPSLVFRLDSSGAKDCFFVGAMNFARITFRKSAFHCFQIGFKKVQRNVPEPKKIAEPKKKVEPKRATKKMETIEPKKKAKNP